MPLMFVIHKNRNKQRWGGKIKGQANKYIGKLNLSICIYAFIHKIKAWLPK